MYSSVVSRDSVKIAFLVGALHALNAMTCNIGNIYLNDPCHKNKLFFTSTKYSKHNGKVCRLVRELYDLESSGVA